jgi:hypothetical protein
MSALVCGRSRGSKIEVWEDWNGESAGRLMQYFQMAKNLALNRGRSVWLMVRPLDNSSSKSLSLLTIFALLNPSSATAHWAVMVSELSKPRLEGMISSYRGTSESLGVLHELRNIGGTTHYKHNPYFYDSELTLRYVGQTEMDDKQLNTYGIYFPAAI